MRPLELLSFHDLLSFREASSISQTSAAALRQSASSLSHLRHRLSHWAEAPLSFVMMQRRRNSLSLTRSLTHLLTHCVDFVLHMLVLNLLKCVLCWWCCIRRRMAAKTATTRRTKTPPSSMSWRSKRTTTIALQYSSTLTYFPYVIFLFLFGIGLVIFSISILSPLLPQFHTFFHDHSLGTANSLLLYTWSQCRVLISFHSKDFGYCFRYFLI